MGASNPNHPIKANRCNEFNDLGKFVPATLKVGGILAIMY